MWSFVDLFFSTRGHAYTIEATGGSITVPIHYTETGGCHFDKLIQTSCLFQELKKPGAPTRAFAKSNYENEACIFWMWGVELSTTSSSQSQSHRRRQLVYYKRRHLMLHQTNFNQPEAQIKKEPEIIISDSNAVTEVPCNIVPGTTSKYFLAYLTSISVEIRAHPDVLEWTGCHYSHFRFSPNYEIWTYQTLSRFFPHISKSPSFSPLQSAYRKFHSTETALLKLTNDILESIDSGKITILTALDMSAAFDTLDHITLLHRLQHTFGLSGCAISWIRSYLTDRSSFVKIDSSSSPSTTILTGVPQGSVLGPLLFVFFISPIANVINFDQSTQNNTVSFHQYADDTQLYIGTNSSALTSQIASIESCTQRVHDWLLNNGLHLNPSKSEAIAFYNPKSKPLAALAESIGTVSVAGSPIRLQTSIKNLGVYLDSKMSFDKQVSETCKACYFHIRALRHIRASLTTEAAKTIAAAIVGSRLDFCNSLLAGTSVSNLTRLQRVQNTLARVVAQKPRFCHITAVLSDLHWLPVRHRITFKIATVTFRVLQSQQPSYLSSLIPRYLPARALRSSSSFSICVPPRKTTMAASKSFSSVVSNTWNALPNHLSSIPTLPVFRRALKHHLFLLAYPDSSAKSGRIKPAQCITLRDTAPTTATAPPGNTMPPI